MIQNRFFYPILVVAIAAIGFGLWKMSAKDAPPEVPKIYHATPAMQTTADTPKASTDVAESGVSVNDVMDVSLPVSHAHNVEERHKLLVAELKSEKTAEQLANPRTKKFFEILESEEYLEQVKKGATYEELNLFMASKGFGTGSPYQSRFRQFFPIGEPADYEPEMRAKLSKLIVENGGYSSEVLSEFSADERTGAWILGHFIARMNHRDTNVSIYADWIKDVERTAMAAMEAAGPALRETAPGSDARAAIPSPNTPTDIQRARERVQNESSDAADALERPSVPLQESGGQLAPSVPELPAKERLQTMLRERFSSERFNRALQTLTQYGQKEGLRHLKTSDPEIAEQVERILQKRQEEE